MSIRVQITEDNVNIAKLLAGHLTTDKDIEIVNISYDGDEAINSYQQTLPDVLILDLNLPKKSGIEVLDTLCNLSYEEKNKCNVIVVSGELPNFLFKYTSKLYRVFSKPYDMEHILLSIHELYKNNNKPNYRSVCEDAVLKLGFNFNSIGTKLLIDTVLFIIENNLSIFNLDYVYKEIAKKHNLSVKKVKWNIEKSLNSMFRYSDKSVLHSLFQEYDGRKLTPKYSIGLAIHELKKIS